MDLLCCENTDESTAYGDPNLLTPRVLKNLLKTEDQYVLSCTAFPKVQTEVTPDMRKIVAEWMMEVCEERKCQDEVYPLAVNCMDRFLEVTRIRKNQLQLLGTACLLLASKLRQTTSLKAADLVFYTENSITVDDLRNWELLVLSKLKWNVAAVTPQDFLRHILDRLPVESIGIEYNMVNNHAKTIIALCAREFEFSRYHPSIIASASIVSALCGVGWVRKSGNSFQDLLDALHDITSIEKEYVEQCSMQIDKMLKAAAASYDDDTDSDAVNVGTPRPDECTPPPTSPGKFQELTTAVTPTDVHDVRF